MSWYEVRNDGTSSWAVVFHGLHGPAMPWHFRTEADAVKFARNSADDGFRPVRQEPKGDDNAKAD